MVDHRLQLAPQLRVVGASLRQKRGTFSLRPLHHGVIAFLDLLPALRAHRSKCTPFLQG
jgi:hypothetical protein